jgi:hypothetical protein
LLGFRTILALFTMAAAMLTVSAPAEAASAAAHAVAATPPSQTIASAQQMTLGQTQSGGGGGTDFWRVRLVGGDRMRLAVTSPVGNGYVFDLYAPGTTDAKFPGTNPVTTAATKSTSGSNTLTLQAPYTATFIFAVCEGPINGFCGNVRGGEGGTDPMNPYTFTPTLIGGGVSAAHAAGEVRASSAIASAPLLTVGNFEAGGGTGTDFWRVRLVGGDKVRLAVTSPVGNGYRFNLYAPGTTDAKFPGANPVSTVATGFASGSNTLTLQAPYTATFIFAVCENAINGFCGNVQGGAGGTDPMNPYTFTPTISKGPKTSTTLKVSAGSVTYGRETGLKFTVSVKALSATGTPAGTVTLDAGTVNAVEVKVCTVKLRGGKGTCSPASGKALAPGSYGLLATYSGSSRLPSSASDAVILKVTG